MVLIQSLLKAWHASSEVAKMDCEIAVIVGGGNIWRGKTGSDLGMDRGTDYMGMLATVMNALALQDSLEQLECDTRVLTSIEMKQVVNHISVEELLDI